MKMRDIIVLYVVLIVAAVIAGLCAGLIAWAKLHGQPATIGAFVLVMFVICPLAAVIGAELIEEYGQ